MIWTSSSSLLPGARLTSLALATLALAACAVSAQTSAGGATAPSRPVTLNWMFYDAPKVITLPCNSTLLLTWADDEPHNVVQVPAADCALDGPVRAASTPAGNWRRTFSRNGSYYYKCSVGTHCTSGNMLLTVKIQGCRP